MENDKASDIKAACVLLKANVAFMMAAIAKKNAWTRPELQLVGIVRSKEGKTLTAKCFEVSVAGFFVV